MRPDKNSSGALLNKTLETYLCLMAKQVKSLRNRKIHPIQNSSFGLQKNSNQILRSKISLAARFEGPILSQ